VAVALSRRGNKLLGLAGKSPQAAKQVGIPQKQAAEVAALDGARKRFAGGGQVKPRGCGAAMRGFGKAR
jgi:hypothetical protein